MTIQEKAKAYDEAIERAKNVLLDCTQEEQKVVEYIVSELNESEDERIRKALMKLVKKAGEGYENVIDGVSIENAISWLEKQGEPTDINPSEFDLRLNKLLKQFETLPKEELVSSLSFYLNVVQNDGTYREEKKSEQKPTDKVEPKFREGEWLCENEPNNYARFIQILETVNVQGKDRYRISRDIHKDEDVVEFGFVEKYYHKFDIKDAKDGDVLCCENGWTCIFKTLVNNETFSSYCFMDNTKWFCETGSECHTLKKEFVKAYNGELYPATKEQRDILEKAMADEGYTFDFEKKELKKIEQKPAWSEEDGAMLYGCIETEQYMLDVVYGRKEFNVGSESIKEECQKELDWLKSLKERYTWKPSDEQMKALQESIGIVGELTLKGECLKELVEQLKAL